MIVVNPTTRQFSIPGADLVFGVTADANSAIKHFQCPRYVGNNVDIASSFVRINYQNAHGDIDFYLVKDVTVDGDNVTFSWELHPKVTMYKGNVSFVMCVTGPDMKVKWHTTLGRGQVFEGLEPDSTLVETETADGIAVLIAMVDAQTVAVEKTGADQVAVVKAAAKTAQDSAVAEVEEKRKNSLESIPDDYTSLGNAVDSLVRGRAGAIVCEVEGSAVAVNDASNMVIQGLRIFGRSTQNGIPTPESPVEIVSVENPVVRVSGKNLFPGHVTNYQNSDGSTVTVNADGSITVHKVAGAGLSFRENIYFPAGTYVISNGLDDGHPVYLQAFNEALYSAASKVIKWPGGMASVFIYSRETTEADVTLFPQIELSDVRTDYEPYKPIQTVETTHPLRGIPVTSGGNYTDENGQQWICDEVDLERGVYVQRVALDELNVATYYLNNRLYCKLDSGTSKYDLVSVCSHNATGIAFGNGAKGAYTSCVVGPSILPNTVTDQSTGQAWLNQQTIAGTPVTVGYVLTTPVESPLSETEIAAYRSLHTNKPSTTILNDSGAHMKVEYAADTKLYIDNKLAALVGNT